MGKNSDAIKIIEKMNNGDFEIQEMIAVASINATIAQLIYEARTFIWFNTKATC